MSSKPENWLALDLSSSSGSICLSSPEGIVRIEGVLPDGGRHSEKLLPCLQEVLSKAEIRFQDIGRFLTVTGPGSFTGLRIALASLKAFFLATAKPIEMADAHEIRALSYLRNHAEVESLGVLTRLTRDNYLLSRYQVRNGHIDRIEESLQKTVPGIEAPLLVDTPDAAKATAIYYPLHARQIAAVLTKAPSRKTLQTWDSVAAATPTYFGSRVY